MFMVWERQTETNGDGGRWRQPEDLKDLEDWDTSTLLYWAIISASLDHTTMSYLQGPTYFFFYFSNRGTKPRSAGGCYSTWVPSHSLELSVTDLISSRPQAETESRLTVSQVSICIYYFTTPTISFKPRDCFRFLQSHTWQRNLWLTARSMVNR